MVSSTCLPSPPRCDQPRSRISACPREESDGANWWSIFHPHSIDGAIDDTVSAGLVCPCHWYAAINSSDFPVPPSLRTSDRRQGVKYTAQDTQHLEGPSTLPRARVPNGPDSSSVRPLVFLILVPLGHSSDPSRVSLGMGNHLRESWLETTRLSSARYQSLCLSFSPWCVSPSPDASPHPTSPRAVLTPLSVEHASRLCECT